MTKRPGPIYQSILRKLKEGLSPTKLVLADESHLHATHRWVRENALTPETHFRAYIVSPQFEGKSLVARHKMCYALVSSELKEQGLHALALDTKTPQEDAEKEG